MKQGEEDAQFMKDSDDESSNYILQKNKKTKVGIYVILTVLILILAAISVSAFFFAE